MKTGAPSKLEVIQNELRQGILQKVWRVGDKLPTESELARKYGCSVGTVNKAVALLVHNGLIERKPRTGTRIISDNMDATGIKLDAFAFIYPSDQHEGIWRAMKGFQAAAQEKKRRLCMLSSGTDYQKELALVGQLAEFDVLGAALYPLLPSFGDLVRFLQMLKDSRFPVVLVGAELPGQEISGVAIDGFHAGYTMTRHLLNGGRRRIGFLASRSWSVSVRDRYQGYKWALSEAGLPLEDKLVFLNPSMHVDFEDPLREPIEMARAYLDQVRDAGLQGVVCYSDFFARGLIRVAAERGLKVPEDLKVTGIDDYAIPIPDEVALTTYRVPYEEMGRIAFELLESRIVNPKGPALEKYVREKSS